MHRNMLHLAVAAGLLGLAACKESTSPAAALYNDSTVTADVAASSGDEMATTVSTMLTNEAAATLTAPPSAFSLFAPLRSNVSWSGSRTCYDSTGAVVNACSPMSSVRKIITAFTLNGSRADTSTVTGGATRIFGGAVHRAGTDTLNRNFTSGSETSRTHSGLVTSHDTTTFSNSATNVARTHDETAADSVRGLTWNLPHSSNLFPVSGYIVRVDTVHSTFTSPTTTSSKTVVKLVKITFPADAQGNVTLTIDNKSCTLNLVTHVVANCH
jgi:hypothetical protein